MENYYDVGDIITLDNKEFCIIKEYSNYYVVISLDKPVDIRVGIFSNRTFSPVTDKNIVKKVLMSE